MRRRAVSQSRLLIVMSDSAWTSAALHLACAMARRRQTDIVLLKMVPVCHPVQLGTEAGALNFTQEDAEILNDMTATAEDYGVCLDVQVCQYANYWHALVGAAEALAVTAVIAHISPTTLPYWHHIRRWLLYHQLARQNQLLLTLDDLTPSLTWTPSLTMQHDLAVQLDRHHIH